MRPLTIQNVHLLNNQQWHVRSALADVNSNEFSYYQFVVSTNPKVLIKCQGLMKQDF